MFRYTISCILLVLLATGARSPVIFAIALFWVQIVLLGWMKRIAAKRHAQERALFARMSMGDEPISAGYMVKFNGFSLASEKKVR
ncbi:MAG: hypothetical protein NUW37_06660 [Planctomycetes bacterium]|nr:hypothetical protein [Planctomycetota bacterium]